MYLRAATHAPMISIKMLNGG